MEGNNPAPVDMEGNNPAPVGIIGNNPAQVGMEDPQLGDPMGEVMVDPQLEEDVVEMLPILGGLLWTDGIKAGQIVPLVIMTVEIHPEVIKYCKIQGEAPKLHPHIPSREGAI